MEVQGLRGIRVRGVTRPRAERRLLEGAAVRERERPGATDPVDRVQVLGRLHLGLAARQEDDAREDRKSTRLNSSHLVISYAVFCLKKKKTIRCALPQRHGNPTSCSLTVLPFGTNSTVSATCTIARYSITSNRRADRRLVFYAINHSTVISHVLTDTNYINSWCFVWSQCGTPYK